MNNPINLDDDSVFDENNPDGIDDSDTFDTRRITEETKSSKQSGSTDAPVTNAVDIPLFIDADKRSTRTGAFLVITKIDKPNSGYKGRIALGSTQETISNLYGNGIYNIDLINQRGQVLRTKESVEISVPENTGGPINSNLLRPSSTSNSENISTLIKSVHLTNQETQKAQVALAKEAGDRSVDLAKSHTQSVLATADASIQRDRTFMEGMISREREFMAAQQASQAQMFQQTMAFMQASHQMTMQILLTQNEGKKDPVELLIAGMQLANSMGGDSDDPPWLKGLEKGAGMIGNIATMALQAKNTKAPANNAEASNNRSPNTKNTKTTKIVTKSEAQAVIKLKETLRKRGIDFEAMLVETEEHYATAETPPPEESGDESEGDSEDTSKESPTIKNGDNTTSVE